MLKAGTHFGFVTSSDEIMFLRFEITERVVEVNIAPRGSPPEIADMDAVKEPRIMFSTPIKHIDVLDTDKGTIPVRLALLHMVHSAMTGEWEMPSDKGKSEAYFATTGAGEKYNLPGLKKWTR
jgi:hypothetical protein